MLFAKLETSFLDACKDIWYDYKDLGYSFGPMKDIAEEIIGQAYKEIKASFHETTENYLLHVEKGLYYNFKPDHKEPQLKTAFIERITDSILIDKSADSIAKEEYFTSGWDTSIERQVFLICLDVYKKYFEQLYRDICSLENPILPEISSQRPGFSLNQLEGKPLFNAFIKKDQGKMFFDRLLEAKWVDFEFNWNDTKNKMMLPAIAKFFDENKDLLAISEANGIARLIKETFNTKAALDTIRKIELVRIKSTRYKKVIALFQFLKT